MDFAVIAIAYGAGMATWAFSSQIWTWIKGEASTVETDVKNAITKTATPAAPAPTTTPDAAK